MRGLRPELECASVSVFSVQDGTRACCWDVRAETHACYEGESSLPVLQFSVVVYEHPGYGPRT